MTFSGVSDAGLIALSGRLNLNFLKPVKIIDRTVGMVRLNKTYRCSYLSIGNGIFGKRCFLFAFGW